MRGAALSTALASGGAACALLAGVAWWRKGATGRGVAALAAAALLGGFVIGGGATPRRNPARRRRTSPLEREIRSCRRLAMAPVRPLRFDRKAEAVAELLDTNPELRDLVERDCGSGCRSFRDWQDGGRRGPKPRAAAGDGRFDSLNEQWERRTPGRKVASWLEALYVTAPSSRRWEDLEERLPPLEDAAGFRLALPSRAERIAVARVDAERCDEIEDPQLAFAF
jgi:hypothetical protein